MKHLRPILWKALVRQYYLQNAGFFLFFFLFFFGIVAPSQQPAYHYALILGILNTPALLALTLFCWLLYAMKCSRWIIGLLQSPDHAFLHVLPHAGKIRAFRLLLEIQAALFLPVMLYAMVVVVIAYIQAARITVLLIFCFIICVCLISAILYWYELFYPGRLIRLPVLYRTAAKRRYTPYWSFLLRGWATQHKALLAGIKLLGCGILYLLLKIQTPDDYDIRMPFLVFSVALLGHGALIYQTRRMEEEKLLFYRSLPVSLFKRLLQYMTLYLLVFLPEIITVGWLMPDHIRIKDALGFVLAGYSTLLLLNSCLFIARLQRSDMIKLSIGIFGILYFGVLSDGLILLSGLFLLTAGSLFFGGYCRKEG
ncbi:MAG TPA: hypothetical protein VHD83_21555 [Puia sp.]|nr:hypothetical protein [Puia sp.]